MRPPLRPDAPRRAAPPPPARVACRGTPAVAHTRPAATAGPRRRGAPASTQATLRSMFGAAVAVGAPRSLHRAVGTAVRVPPRMRRRATRTRRSCHWGAPTINRTHHGRLHADTASPPRRPEAAADTQARDTTDAAHSHDDRRDERPLRPDSSPGTRWVRLPRAPACPRPLRARAPTTACTASSSLLIAGALLAFVPAYEVSDSLQAPRLAARGRPR
jgi:hypothetical protein